MDHQRKYKELYKVQYREPGHDWADNDLPYFQIKSQASAKAESLRKQNVETAYRVCPIRKRRSR